MSMSYANILVLGGKSQKVAELDSDSKSSKNVKGTKQVAPRIHASKAGKEDETKAVHNSSVRSIDTPDTIPVQYASIIDVTRMSDPAALPSNAKQTSSSVSHTPAALATLLVATFVALYLSQGLIS